MRANGERNLQGRDINPQSGASVREAAKFVKTTLSTWKFRQNKPPSIAERVDRIDEMIDTDNNSQFDDENSICSQEWNIFDEMLGQNLWHTTR